MAAGEPDSFYQQNHCGVYRSTDAGRSWEDISAGLVSEFGFVMGAHPRDPATGWVIPLTHPEEGRISPDGALGVWRTNDRGDSWQRHGEGLPQQDAFVGVLREAIAVDRRDPAGVYFGTSTGQLYGSIDEGVSWSLSPTICRRSGGSRPSSSTDPDGDHHPAPLADRLVSGRTASLRCRSCHGRRGHRPIRRARARDAQPDP